MHGYLPAVGFALRGEGASIVNTLESRFHVVWYAIIHGANQRDTIAPEFVLTAFIFMTEPLARYQARIETALSCVLPPAGERLADAMRYATLGGGKRLRAALLYATADDFGVPPDSVDAAACAVEAIHAYSLIHDDLPAMDDDDLRRGRPSTHRAFDEATAILAGDALNTLAFALLANSPLPPATRLAQIHTLADAAGWAGMIGGQMGDMAATGKTLTLPQLQAIHRGKTGALIRAALHLGALPATDYAAHAATLDELGEQLGIAYQIADDILDATANSATLGKTAGKDAAQGKNTYPALLGLEESRAIFAEHSARAQAATTRLPHGAPHLCALLARIIHRSH